MNRIACFYVPMFPLAARLRSEPELLQEALAIVEGNGNNAHIVAATRRARTKGIRAGHSLAQARSILPKLIARGRDAECERTAQEALLEVAETFSPRVEDAGDGIVYVDIAGMERHYQASGLGPRASEVANNVVNAPNSANADSACAKNSRPYAKSGVPNSIATTANVVRSSLTPKRAATAASQRARRIAGIVDARSRIALSVARMLCDEGGPTITRAIAYAGKPSHAAPGALFEYIRPSIVDKSSVCVCVVATTRVTSTV